MSEKNNEEKKLSKEERKEKHKQELLDLVFTERTPEERQKAKEAVKELEEVAIEIPQNSDFPHLHGQDEQMGRLVADCLISPKEQQVDSLINQLASMLSDEAKAQVPNVVEKAQAYRDESYQKLQENYGADTASFLNRNFIIPHNDAVNRKDKVVQALVVKKLAIFFASLCNTV